MAEAPYHGHCNRMVELLILTLIVVLRKRKKFFMFICYSMACCNVFKTFQTTSWKRTSQIETAEAESKRTLPGKEFVMKHLIQLQYVFLLILNFYSMNK